MLDNKGFDLWADGYDKSVNISDESDVYPFAGYKNVLNTIYNIIKTTETATILDIGFGTGALTKKLYDEGYSICGIDFSAKMIEIARTKMKKANLIQHDFTRGLPTELEKVKFDYIICTYAIHHLQDEQKVSFISELLDRLSDNGKILIGDVAFETRADCDKCKAENTADWDNDEIYPIFEMFSGLFKNVRFEKVSFCSGVLCFTK